MEKILLGTGIALSLAACGGGGGSSSSSASLVPTAVISSSNEAVVAQDTTTGSFSPLTGTQTLTGVQSGDDHAVFAAVWDQLEHVPAYVAQAASQQQAAGVISSSTLNCASGGTLSVSVSDADNSGTVTAGDSLSIVANNCVSYLGAMSGSMTLSINGWSGSLTSSPPVYDMSMTIGYNNFSMVATSGYTSTLNGSMTATIRASGNYTQYSSISASSLTAAATFSGVTRTRTLTNYSASYQRAPNVTYTSQTSYTVNGMLSSSALGSANTFSFSTTTPLVVYGAQTYPTSGQVLITGASNTKLRLTSLDNTTVQRELDANGDGSYESIDTVAWNTLL